MAKLEKKEETRLLSDDTQEKVEIVKGKNAETTNLIERFLNMISTHGVKRILESMLLVVLAVFLGMFIFNPQLVFKGYENYKNKQHTESVLKRINSYPEINATLLAIQKETNADRVLIYETHNGGSNLANLPFLYVDLSYGIPKDEFSMLSEEYINVKLSRYPWATELYEHNVWSAPIEDMEAVDPELYYRLKKEDVDYFYAILLYGKDTLPCGFLALVYKDREKLQNREQLLAKVMVKYSNILAALLTPVE